MPSRERRGHYNLIQTYDGEWIRKPRRVIYEACCDCGLVHKVRYRTKGDAIQKQVYRDTAETAKERRRTGKNKQQKRGQK